MDGKVYIAEVNVHFFGGGSYSFKLGFLALFDPHDNSIKLGKIVISVPILQMKKLRCRVIILYSWDFLGFRLFNISYSFL